MLPDGDSPSAWEVTEAAPRLVDAVLTCADTRSFRQVRLRSESRFSALVPPPLTPGGEIITWLT